MSNLIIGAIVVVIIILFWTIGHSNTSSYEEFLYGMWVGDDEFCKNANIDSIMMFLGEPDVGLMSCTRDGYIIIVIDGEPVVNQGFILNYSPGWSGPSIGPYTVSSDVTFDEENIWEDDVTITVNIVNGTMRIYNGDTMYAKLYKENTLSNILVE